MSNFNKLYNIVRPFDDWWNNGGEESNIKAKEALCRFYYELIKIKPEEEYMLAERLPCHFSYLPNMVAVERALVEKKYMRACNELISLMHYEPFFQRRIYFNVVSVLKTYLRIKQGCKE